MQVKLFADALIYAVHVESFLALAVLALVVSVFEWLGALPDSVPWLIFPLARTIPVFYLFMIARKAAIGSKRMPQLSDFRDTWDAVIHPLLQLLFIGIWYCGPILIYAHHTVGMETFFDRLFARPMELFRRADLVTLGIFALTTAYLPLGIIGALCSRAVMRLADPTFGLRRVWKIPKEYVLLFAALCVLEIVVFSLDSFGAAIQRALPIPIVARVIRHMLVFFVVLIEARLLGDFVFQNEKVLKRNVV